MVGAGEDDVDGVAAEPGLASSGRSGTPVHSAVPTASTSHGWLTGRGDSRARPLPAHSSVTGRVTRWAAPKVGQAQRQRLRDRAVERQPPVAGGSIAGMS